MEQEQKQKVLIGALVVLALGAGSYFFLAGGDDAPQAFTDTGPAERKERQVDVPEVKTRTTARTTEARDVDSAPAERAERVQEEREEGPGRTRRGEGPTKKSNKKQAPAA